ncbi:hypothetical protein RFH43_19985, partial [Acinetobacter baumannii]|nr:hypothetical protein [Acinetobacter baumannii]MDQ8785123.1 hypothetical protein [Acinetobacter baumannii]
PSAKGDDKFITTDYLQQCLRAYGWQSGGLLYVGLALMVGVSVWDFISPAHRRCGPDSCELPEQRG